MYKSKNEYYAVVRPKRTIRSGENLPAHHCVAWNILNFAALI
ncbi:MAG: hypothetical protein ACNYPI_05535 [Arenicellales bacterium WSBS_2016_MAG_OTU3]